MKMAKILTDLDGTSKKRRVKMRFTSVHVANPKANQGLPRVLIPGGVTKVDTRSKIQKTSVIKVKAMVKYRNARMLQRLYGETAGSSGASRPAWVELTRFGNSRVCSSGAIWSPSSGSLMAPFEPFGCLVSRSWLRSLLGDEKSGIVIVLVVV